MRFENKVAVVTGSSTGLGRAFALALAREGAGVVVTSRDRASAQATADQIRSVGTKALAVQLDVSDERSAKQMVEQTLRCFGAIDILVNNAGIVTPFCEVVDLPVEDWDRTVTVNLRGTFLCSKAVLPSMIARSYGKIVNIAAGVLEERVHVGLSAYCASKAAVVNFTRQLAAEVRKHGINVNALDPGAVATRMAGQFELSDESRAWLAKQQSVEEELRFRPLEQIVPILLFLASDDARALTGRLLQVASQDNPKYLQL